MKITIPLPIGKPEYTFMLIHILYTLIFNQENIMNPYKNILTKHYPHLLPLIENAIYNETQNIEDYFGKDIMVIYNGHNGCGWNIRRLVGDAEEDGWNKCYFSLHYLDHAGVVLSESLLWKQTWQSSIVLPEKN